MILVKKEKAYTDDEILLLMLNDDYSKEFIKLLKENELEIIYRENDSDERFKNWLSNILVLDYEEAFITLYEYWLRQTKKRSPIILTDTMISYEIYSTSENIFSFDDYEYVIYLSQKNQYMVAEVLIPEYCDSDLKLKNIEDELAELL
jgi:hypothetical protein